MTNEKSIADRANEHYMARFDDEQRRLIETADDFESDERDHAMEALQDQLLSFERLTTHHRAEIIEWELLLGTGGPADRVLVETDFQGRVLKAEYQFQDWFEPWTRASAQDDELVRRFAEIVGYYEIDE